MNNDYRVQKSNLLVDQTNTMLQTKTRIAQERAFKTDLLSQKGPPEPKVAQMKLPSECAPKYSKANWSQLLERTLAANDLLKQKPQLKTMGDALKWDRNGRETLH